MAAETKRKSRHPILKVFLCILLVLILTGGAVIGYAALKAKYTVVYQGYTATTGNITDSLEYSSTIKLITSSTVSAEAEGEVQTIYVSAGDQVTDGQKLMKLSGGQLIKADMDGTVNAIGVSVGDKVTAGTGLVQLADFEHLRVSFSVSEYDIDVVQRGTECTISVTATGQKLQGTVKSIDYSSTSRGSIAYYTAVIDVNAQEGIYPGMQVKVKVSETLASDAVMLKCDALSFDNENHAIVYKQQEDGTMLETQVTLGEKNDDYVQILSGVESGEIVYAKVETEAEAGLTLASLFSSMGGGMGGGSMPSGGNMPSGGFSGGPSGGFSGGPSGSFGGGSSGGSGGFGGGSSGGFGGGSRP